MRSPSQSLADHTQAAAAALRTVQSGAFALAARSALLALAMGALAAPKAGWAACSDDFSGPALAPAWSFMDADGVQGGSYTLADGRLSLIGRGRDAFNSVNEFVGIRRMDITGDFDVSVKLEEQANTHEWAQAGIMAAADLSDLKKGGYVVLDASPANGYNLFYDAAQPAGTLDKFEKAAASSGYPVWLRLARTGNKFSAWYRKAADAAWVSIATDIAPVGTTGPSQLALMSLSHNQSRDGKAVFDDFTCLHAPVVIRMTGPSIRKGITAESAGGFAAFWDVSGRKTPAGVLFHRP